MSKIVIKYKCSRKCVEHLFPSILAQAQVCNKATSAVLKNLPRAFSKSLGNNNYLLELLFLPRVGLGIIMNYYSRIPKIAIDGPLRVTMDQKTNTCTHSDS